jgi:hypothetical protein
MTGSSQEGENEGLQGIVDFFLGSLGVLAVLNPFSRLTRLTVAPALNFFLKQWLDVKDERGTWYVLYVCLPQI